MIFVYAFLVGGAICAIAQIVYDLFKLSPGHLTAYFVMLGCVLDIFDIYDKLVEFSGAGALLPITSFGHTMMHSAIEAYKESGILGFFDGILANVSFGICITVFLSFICAIIFKPKH